jgi:hypothetical protein
MLKLAKLLYSRGFRITFVNNEYNHKRFLKTGGLDALAGSPDFQFESIPDGLPVSDSDTTQEFADICVAMRDNMFSPFLELLERISPVTCILSDVVCTYPVKAGEKLGIPVVLSWTVAACVVMTVCYFHELRNRGYVPVKDESDFTKGYMETEIDWIPGTKNIRLKDFPSFIQITDPNDLIFNHLVECSTINATKASANIIETFEELETDIVNHISSIISDVYTIGPLEPLLAKLPKEEHLDSIGYSLWKEEPECLKWLDSRKENSVLYVNFGSIAVMSSEKVMEFARGLANSEKDFLWIIRPDMVVGEAAVLLSEFLEGTKDRGFTTSWCPQEEVLKHPSVWGFLTHCGWNSTIESLSAGVPMICLPFFGDQPTNCKYICNEWEAGLEMDEDFKSDDVERVVREFMDGDNGKKMKKKALEWKEKAAKATSEDGSSYINLDRLVNKIIQF